MRTRTARVAAALVVGALVGFGIPLVELWWKCRAPDSEGCVWGKSYLPLSIAVGAGVSLVLALVAYAIIGVWADRSASGPDAS